MLGYAYVSRAAAQGLEPAQGDAGATRRDHAARERQKALALANAMAEAPAPRASQTGKAGQAASVSPSQPKRRREDASRRPARKPCRSRQAAAGGSSSAPSRQRGAAEALYRQLAGNRALAGRRPYYIPAGTVTRLQVGPFASRAAAAAACARARRQACFPVAGNSYAGTSRARRMPCAHSKASRP